jgi:hypothetical protein
MSDVKRTRLFICNPDSGEPWAYCGDLPAPTAPAEEWSKLGRCFGDFVANEVGADFGGQEGDRFTVEVKRVEMTDAEVAAMPEE